MKIVPDKGQHSGSPLNGFTSDANAYQPLADLRGKTVALASAGSGNEIMRDRGMQSVGLSQKDISVKQLAVPDMLAALSTHANDAAVEIEPFVAQGQAQGILLAGRTSNVSSVETRAMLHRGVSTLTALDEAINAAAATAP